ncbi:MAG TPA: hypothetical protein VEA41_23465 [Salinarimonas sp.]|nr:hypothetical protein [Salinarimonas sp.]
MSLLTSSRAAPLRPGPLASSEVLRVPASRLRLMPVLVSALAFVALFAGAWWLLRGADLRVAEPRPPARQAAVPPPPDLIAPTPAPVPAPLPVPAPEPSAPPPILAIPAEPEPPVEPPASVAVLPQEVPAPAPPAPAPVASPPPAPAVPAPAASAPPTPVASVPAPRAPKPRAAPVAEAREEAPAPRLRRVRPAERKPPVRSAAVPRRSIEEAAETTSSTRRARTAVKTRPRRAAPAGETVAEPAPAAGAAPSLPQSLRPTEP